MGNGKPIRGEGWTQKLIAQGTRIPPNLNLDKRREFMRGLTTAAQKREQTEEQDREERTMNTRMQRRNAGNASHSRKRGTS